VTTSDGTVTNSDGWHSERTDTIRDSSGQTDRKSTKSTSRKGSNAITKGSDAITKGSNADHDPEPLQTPSIGPSGQPFATPPIAPFGTPPFGTPHAYDLIFNSEKSPPANSSDNSNIKNSNIKNSNIKNSNIKNSNVNSGKSNSSSGKAHPFGSFGSAAQVFKSPHLNFSQLSHLSRIDTGKSVTRANHGQQAEAENASHRLSVNHGVMQLLDESIEKVFSENGFSENGFSGDERLIEMDEKHNERDNFEKHKMKRLELRGCDTVDDSDDVSLTSGETSVSRSDFSFSEEDAFSQHDIQGNAHDDAQHDIQDDNVQDEGANRTCNKMNLGDSSNNANGNINGNMSNTVFGSEIGSFSFAEGAGRNCDGDSNSNSTANSATSASINSAASSRRSSASAPTASHIGSGSSIDQSINQSILNQSLQRVMSHKSCTSHTSHVSYASGSIGSPPSGSLGSPPSGSFGSPPFGSLGSPPSGSLGSPPSGSLGSPPSGSFGAPSSLFVSPQKRKKKEKRLFPRKEKQIPCPELDLTSDLWGDVKAIVVPGPVSTLNFRMSATIQNSKFTLKYVKYE
jgi:hypothetical protein